MLELTLQLPWTLCRLLYAHHSSAGHNAHVDRLAELAKFCHDRKKVSSLFAAAGQIGPELPLGLCDGAAASLDSDQKAVQVWCPCSWSILYTSA
jgi:hypothetical protein